MLAEMVSDAAVGTYAVASRVSEVWYIVPTVIANSLFPKIIEIRDRDPEKFKAYLQMGYDLLFCLALVIALPISFYAKPIIAMLFGNAYEQAAPVLAVHIWAGLFIFMRALFSKWLVVEHLLLFSLISHGFGAIANVLMNLLLIPMQGALGAAIATVISYSASSYLALFLSKKNSTSSIYDEHCFYCTISDNQNISKSKLAPFYSIH